MRARSGPWAERNSFREGPVVPHRMVYRIFAVAAFFDGLWGEVKNTFPVGVAAVAAANEALAACYVRQWLGDVQHLFDQARDIPVL